MSEWIKTSKRLPEPDIDVLIYVPYHGVTTAGYIDMDTGEWMTSIGGYRIRYEVTHWKPMDEPED